MITVICPVYNEEKYIEKVLDFFIRAKPEDKELLIIDGNSNDKTREIVKSWSTRYSKVRLLDNPDRTVPFALNIAIKESHGDPVIRLDAHTIYADDYFEKIIETFANTGADIVGGPMRATGKSDLQRTIASATSSSFGIGNSSFHNENYEGYVDSVYLGAWKRNIFKDIGLFDVQMKRNQDDEFHYRANSKGKKIYLNPQIKSFYFPRDSFKKLFIQYFQYGLYKPLVLRKVKSGIRLRHLVPAIFVLYLISLPFLFLISGLVSFIPGLLYLIIDLIYSFRSGNNFAMKIAALLVYPVLHLSYGSGFIVGLFKLR